MKSPAVVFLLLIALAIAIVLLARPGAEASPDSGWSYPAALNTNAASDSAWDLRPQVTTDGTGNWLAVWHSDENLYDPNLGGTIGGDTDILVARSTDNGATWTAPTALNTSAATDSGDDYHPEVTTDGGGHWLAVWYSDDSLGGTTGTDADILVARSTDNGATWTVPAALNTNAASDSALDELPQVTADGGGNWLAVWNSSEDPAGDIGTDDDILVARSTDNGANWTAPAALNTNAPADLGDDEYPQVTTDGGGNWVAVWESEDSLEGSIGWDRDILVARSTDSGATWTAPAALNTNAATDLEDDEFAQVTTDGGGNWLAVWESDDELGGTIGWDRDILVAGSTDNGATWTAPAALNTNAATDSENDHCPQVTTDGGGNWVALWSSWDSLSGTIGTDGDILMARSTDNGASWTTPAALNTNAATDSENDWYPQVTTDGGGNWLAVWESRDDLGDTIGPDYDILVARSPNTAVGTDVSLPLNGGLDEVGGIEVTFSEVTAGGDTTLMTSTGGPPPPSGYKIVGLGGQPLYYDIETTAIFEGPITVCIKYDETEVGGAESGLKLMHKSDGGFEDITLSPVDTANDIICGETATLSFFAVMEPVPAAVGGMAELPDVSDSGGRSYVALAGLAAAALVALSAGGWYARRRWLR